MTQPPLETKVCSKCGIEKALVQFYFRRDSGKYRLKCIECHNLARRSSYQDNKEDILARNKDYYWENKEEICHQKSEYRIENHDQILKRETEYKKNNPDKVRESQRKKNRKRIANDPAFKLRKNISRQVNLFLKANGSSKAGQSVLEFLPYTPPELKEYVEELFEPWMTWDNYGRYVPETWDDDDTSTWTWQLDHIKPHSTFHYKTMDCDEFRECWALSNLRPYSAKLNVIEGTSGTRHKSKPTKKTKSDKPKKSKR